MERNGYRTPLRVGVGVCLVLALVLGIQSELRAVNNRKIPFLGYFWVTDPTTTPPTNNSPELVNRANLAVLSPDHDPVNDPSFAATYINNNISVILQLGADEVRLKNLNGEWQAYMAIVKAKTDASGLTSKVVGFAISEEWYTRLKAGEFSSWPSFAGLNPQVGSDYVTMANMLKSALGNLNSITKQQFYPSAAVVHVENFFNDNVNYAGPFNYHPIPVGVEVLALDPYMTGSNYNASDCNRLGPMGQKFDAEVKLYYDYAATNYGQSILMVGQAFRSSDGSPPWNVMPSPCHLVWYYELAQLNLKVVGITWFAWTSVPGIVGARDVAATTQQLDAIWNYNASLP